MHLFIHIGDHKTGTTSIQAYLRSHAAELAAAGIHVPISCTYAEDSGHHNLAFELLKDKRWNPQDGGIEALLAELRRSGSPKGVISCEDFSFLITKPSSIEMLESALRKEGHTLSWLMFLRRVDDYSESLYCELLKGGRRPRWGYPGFVITGLLKGHYGNKYFDHGAFARRWRLASSSPLHLYDYDQALSSDGVLPCFLRAIGAPAALCEASSAYPVFNQKKAACLRRYRRLLRPLLRARFHRSNQRLTALCPAAG